MLYREIIAVCSQIHIKHINTLCRQDVELLNVKLVVHIVTTVRHMLWKLCGTNSNHWALKGVYKWWALQFHRTSTNGLFQTISLPERTSQWSHYTLFCSRSWYCFVSWTARPERLSELICTETSHCHCLLKLNTHWKCHLSFSVFPYGLPLKTRNNYGWNLVCGR